MTELTIFKNFNKVVENRTFETIAELIRNGKFQQQVESLQNLLLEGKDKEYTKKKKSLSAFTPSGKFEGGRKMEFLTEYSRVIILDIDKLDAETLKIIKQKTIECNYTYSCFISPSNKGLKILVRTDNSVAKHKETFLNIQAHYEKLLNIKIDPSGKDITRLCFMSYDKNLYINRESETFKTEISMSITSDIEKLIKEIDGYKVDITSNYDDWLKIAFAIESEFGESGRHYFHSISKYNPNYSSEVCNEQYSKCMKSNNTGISIKTLFYFAKQNGISINSLNNNVQQEVVSKTETSEKKVTANKFTITEEYLNQRYDVRYNTISNKFEYKEKLDDRYKEMNENNMFIKLQKDNINISLNHLIALLKSDFVTEYNVFQDYFENLPVWDEAKV